MKEASRSQPKKADKYSARMHVRIDTDFKKQFLKYCKDHHVNSSDTIRKALQQYVNLGNFKQELFEYLHNNDSSRKKFEEFLKTLVLSTVGKNMVKTNNLMSWFIALLGTEEEKLINETPFILLPSIEGKIITPYGKKIFEGRINSDNE